MCRDTATHHTTADYSCFTDVFGCHAVSMFWVKKELVNPYLSHAEDGRVNEYSFL